MAKTKDRKFNTPLLLAVVMLFLTLVSSHFTAGLYARYSVSDTAADSARVAVMASGVQGFTTEPVSIAPGEEKEIKFTLTNGNGAGKTCEVALDYTISVVNRENNLPLTWQLYKNGSAAGYTGSFSANVYEQNEYILKVKWPEDKKNPDLAFEVDVLEITITAEQVD